MVWRQGDRLGALLEAEEEKMVGRLHLTKGYVRINLVGGTVTSFRKDCGS